MSGARTRGRWPRYKRRLALWGMGLASACILLRLRARRGGPPLYDRERDREAGLPLFPLLPPIADRRAAWPPDPRDVACIPKIYVYPQDEFPARLGLAQIAHCRWSQYSSEIYLYNSLLNSRASAIYFTDDPSEANFFLVPLFASCYLFNCWTSHSWDQTLRCGVDQDYILPMMNTLRGNWPYWNTSQGRDHVFFHPMDKVDEYYSASSRRLMRDATYLTTLGDRRSPSFPNAAGWRARRDIVVPSATHLLHAYHIRPMDYLSPEGDPLVHTPLKDEEPPTDDPFDLYNPTSQADGKRRGWLSLFARDRLTTSRTILALFRGSGEDTQPSDAYSLGVRSLFFPAPEASPVRHPGFASLPQWDIAASSPSQTAYALALSRARYGLAPPGHTLDTTRIWEYLAFGVVPVFVGADGLVLPFEDEVDWSEFSVRVKRKSAHRLPQILEGIGDEEYEGMRRRVWEVGRTLVLEEAQGFVWHYIARELCKVRPELASGPEKGRQTIQL